LTEEKEVIFSPSGKNEELLNLCKNNQSFYIAIITPNYVNDERCLQELETAYANNLRFYGFVLEGTKLPDSIRKKTWEFMMLCRNEKELSIEAAKLVKRLTKKK